MKYLIMQTYVIHMIKAIGQGQRVWEVIVNKVEASIWS